MMDWRVKTTVLREIIEECDCDCDCDRYLDFEEFCQITVKILIEFEEEGNQKRKVR